MMTAGFFGCFLEGVVTVVMLYEICRTGRNSGKGSRRRRR